MTSHQQSQAPGAGRDSQAQADYRPVPVGAAPRGPVRKPARKRKLLWASVAIVLLAGGAGLGWASGIELPSELRDLVRPLRMMASGSDGGASAGAALPLDLHAWKNRVENAQRESTARIDALTAQVDALRQDLDHSRADLAARLDRIAAKLDRLEQSGPRAAARRESEPQSAAAIPVAPKPKRVAAQPKPPANRSAEAPQQAAAAEPASSREATASAASQRRAPETQRTAASEGNIFQRAGRWIVSTSKSIVSSD